MPVLHLTEDLQPEAAVEYARSVEAAWICYPAEGGVKLATVDPPGEFGLMSSRVRTRNGAVMSKLRVAVPKGAIFDDALSALELAGLPAAVHRTGEAHLQGRSDNEFIVSSPSDVPVFVEYGATRHRYRR